MELNDPRYVLPCSKIRVQIPSFYVWWLWNVHEKLYRSIFLEKHTSWSCKALIFNLTQKHKQGNIWLLFHNLEPNSMWCGRHILILEFLGFPLEEREGNIRTITCNLESNPVSCPWSWLASRLNTDYRDPCRAALKLDCTWWSHAWGSTHIFSCVEGMAW